MDRRDPDGAEASVVGITERYEMGVVPLHTHGRGQVLYAVSGAMAVLTATGSWVLPPHRALWIPAGLAHSLKCRSAVELRTLYMRERLVSGARWQSCVVVEVTPLMRELILAAVALPWDWSDNSAASRLVGVLIDRLSEAAGEMVHLPEPRDPRARRFVERMFAAPADRRPLTLLAREIGTSARTLERLFKSETGMSVGAWVQQMRLVLAIEQLASGASVGDAAFAVGYENPSSLIAVFRRAFGTTPGKYVALG